MSPSNHRGTHYLESMFNALEDLSMEKDRRYLKPYHR